jgi:hypothetical protein
MAYAMATKLSLYNGALLMLGERAIAALSEDREPRRLLDLVWDNGGVRTCLETGLWNFAMRSMRIEYDPNLAPDFGFRRAFAKPEDWVRTGVAAVDAYFRPLKAHEFADEADYWFADVDTLYVKMVSDGAEYGSNFSAWPESFSRYVETYLAVRIAGKLTRSGSLVQALKDDLKRLKTAALAKDANNEGAAFPPEGSWNRSRRQHGFRDLGSRRQLVG